ncbi:sugar MFS transporter [Occallatibacter savannae]|uniref:sugar MFS transporter n=1 Tax=Occallatibacter savannae TaxID=1002691 RepID=UPI000D698F05|nr:sugar MFS transporter [Occallatibacter savannae]
MATRSTPATAATTPNYTGPFITVTALYFIFGFITNLNMQLVPHLRSVFDLPWFQAALANGAFFTAYFVVSSPTSKLIESIGYKRTMVVSLFVQVAGALLFLPAASIPNFWLFLTAVFIVGSGVAMLQTSANPYVSALGPESSAPVRQNLAQAFNSIGGMIAPLVAGALILKHKVVLDAATLATKSAQEQLAYKISIASTVRMPYLAIAAALVLLGVAVSFAHLPTIKNTQEFRPTKEGIGLLDQSIWSYRHTVLATLGIFFYVGVEVGLAQFMVGYFGLPEIGAMTAAAAAAFTFYYWLGALIGRLLGSWMLTKINAGRLLGIFGLMNVLCVAFSISTKGNAAIYSLVLCGFFNSIMFPNIFALGITGLGPMTSKGSGLIMTAVVGGAVIPVLLGKLVDNFGFRPAAILPIICYLFIAYYGFVGHKPSRTVTA